MKTPEKKKRFCKNDDCERPVEKGRRICSSCHNKQRTPEAVKRARAKFQIYRSNYRKQQKQNVLAAYGGKCYCCGEDNAMFLTIDHINNDGGEQRRINQHFRNIFVALTTKPVDLNTYRVACFSCNCGRQVNNGTVCPHQEL
jgi:hypothetical protein